MPTEEDEQAKRLLKHECVVKLSGDAYVILPLNKEKEWVVGSFTYAKKPCRKEKSQSDYRVWKVGGAWRCDCTKKGCAHIGAVELSIGKRMRKASERQAAVLAFLREKRLFVTKDAICRATGLPSRKVGSALAKLVKAKKVAKYVSGQPLGFKDGKFVGKRYTNRWGVR